MISKDTVSAQPDYAHIPAEVSNRAGSGDQLSLIMEDDADELFKLGWCYLYGEGGTQQSDDEAQGYLMAASKLGHSEAQFELATLLTYLKDEDAAYAWLESSASLGFGPAILAHLDYTPDLLEHERKSKILKARAFYLSRANSGDAEWQFKYANLLRDRRLYAADAEEALRWLKSSADQNYILALKHLGYYYLTRTLISDSEVKYGIKCLVRATELGDAHSCLELGDLFLRGHVGRDIQPAKVVRDPQVGITWYERGNAMGLSRAAYILGVEYLSGEYLNRNILLAENWLLQAATNGNTFAQVDLGNEYASGLRLRHDFDAAIHWLSKANSSHKRTSVKMAEMHFSRNATPQDFLDAMRYLDDAIDGEIFRVDAMKLASEKCFDDRFTTLQETVAHGWLAKMASITIESVADVEHADFRSRARYLGSLYELGLGIGQDREKAIYWYRQSAISGGYPARRRLEELGVDWNSLEPDDSSLLT